MKNLLLLALLSSFGLKTLTAQNINWKWAENERRHYAHLNLGYDFGITTQLGYNYLVTNKKPILLTVDYSVPMGAQLFDDFKLRLGGQVQTLMYKDFGVSIKALAATKRHETDMVRMADIGLETSIVLGYYKPTWHIASEFGLMKPIASHLMHAEVTKENFPSISDGWYTSTGGHYFYGLQGGKSLNKGLDISLRIGATKAQGTGKDAIIPKYAQIGFIKKFGPS